jgi:hypothetical protein
VPLYMSEWADPGEWPSTNRRRFNDKNGNGFICENPGPKGTTNYKDDHII